MTAGSLQRRGTRLPDTGFPRPYGTVPGIAVFTKDMVSLAEYLTQILGVFATHQNMYTLRCTMLLVLTDSRYMWCLESHPVQERASRVPRKKYDIRADVAVQSLVTINTLPTRRLREAKVPMGSRGYTGDLANVVVVGAFPLITENGIEKFNNRSTAFSDFIPLHPSPFTVRLY